MCTEFSNSKEAVCFPNLLIYADLRIDHDHAKVEVASSSLVSRPISMIYETGISSCFCVLEVLSRFHCALTLFEGGAPYATIVLDNDFLSPQVTMRLRFI